MLVASESFLVKHSVQTLVKTAFMKTSL